MIRLLLLLVSFNVCSQATDSLLSVQDAIAFALDHNYDIRLEKNNLDLSTSNNTLGNAGFLPTVEASGSASQSVQDTELTLDFGNGPVTQSRDGASSTRYAAGVAMEWTLFDGLKMFTTKDKLQELEMASYQALQARIQNAIANVMKAYFNAALEQERMALLNSTLVLSEERVQISKDKYEVGKASKLEYLQAQVDYNTDKSALVKQQEVIANRKLELLQLMGVENANTQFNLETSFESTQNISQEDFERNALLNNPDLLSLQRNQLASQLTVKERQREIMPSLDFNLGYNFSDQTNEVGALRNNRATGLNYGLTATMTLFDGNNQKRVVQNARIQMETAQVLYEQAQTQLRTAVRSAYLTYNNSLQLVNLEKENLLVAQENEEIALERFRIGKSNALEIREAQNNAVNAQIRYLEALNTAKIAEIELMRLSGQILL